MVWYLTSGAWSSNAETKSTNETVPEHTISPVNKPLTFQKPVYVLPEIKPHSLISADTPIGQLCDELIYAGFELKKDKYGRYSSVHFFHVNYHTMKKNLKNDEDFIKPSLIVDGYYLNHLGFSFEFLNRMPILTYNGIQYIFPRY